MIRRCDNCVEWKGLQVYHDLKPTAGVCRKTAETQAGARVTSAGSFCQFDYQEEKPCAAQK